MVKFGKKRLILLTTLLLLIITSCQKSTTNNDAELLGAWVRTFEKYETDNSISHWSERIEFMTENTGYEENYKFNKLASTYSFNYFIDGGKMTIEWEQFSKQYNYEIRNDSLFMTSIEPPYSSYREFRVYTRPVEKEFMPDTVEIFVNEAYCSKRGDYCLKFDTVYSDSRCPIDVNCVWEGNAELGFILYSSNADLQFTLNTSSQFTRDTSINSNMFKVINLLPYPVSTDTVNQPDYKVILVLD